VANTPFTYVSKVYAFGAGRTDPGVAASVQAGVPTTLMVVASWGRGVQNTVVYAGNDVVDSFLTADEDVTLTVNFGRPGVDLTVLDTSIGVNLLNTEITIPSGNLPVSSPDTTWSVQFTLTLSVDVGTDSDYAATELFTGYCYRNTVTSRPEFHQEAVASSVSMPLVQGVQGVFFLKGTRLQMAVGVSDYYGKLRALLPPGSYDLELYGNNFTEADWLTGTSALTVGASAASTAFGATSATVASDAEFAYFKSLFASLRWPGYMIPEDFTDARKADRFDDPTAIGAAYQNLGRVYRGRSWFEYVGIVTNPSPT
jgi:hypothetical protein